MVNGILNCFTFKKPFFTEHNAIISIQASTVSTTKPTTVPSTPTSTTSISPATTRTPTTTTTTPAPTVIITGAFGIPPLPEVVNF